MIRMAYFSSIDVPVWPLGSLKWILGNQAWIRALARDIQTIAGIAFRGYLRQ